MPVVKLHYQAGLFSSDSSPALLLLVRTLKRLVASNLDCIGYTGERINLKEKDVDVLPTPFPKGQGSFLILVEIVAYDYPDRMQTITSRLKNLKSQLICFLDMTALLPNEAGFLAHDTAAASVLFVAIAHDCWV